jgi:hypothetical protein
LFASRLHRKRTTFLVALASCDDSDAERLAYFVRQKMCLLHQLVWEAINLDDGIAHWFVGEKGRNRRDVLIHFPRAGTINVPAPRMHA